MSGRKLKANRGEQVSDPPEDKCRRKNLKREPQNRRISNIECRRKEHTKKRTEEPQNVEGRYSARRELLCRTVYFIKKTERHAAQAPALRELNHPSKFGSAAFDRLKP